MMDASRRPAGPSVPQTDPIEDDPDHILGRLQGQLGEHSDPPRSSGRGLAVRGHALAERILSEELPTVDNGPPEARRAVVRATLRSYATELQTVITALDEHEQAEVAWVCGTGGWAWSSPTR